MRGCARPGATRRKRDLGGDAALHDLHVPREEQVDAGRRRGRAGKRRGPVAEVRCPAGTPAQNYLPVESLMRCSSGSW